ncbi:outer membrane receptor for ferrienterochelin and colicins [Mariniphaga anaerophila]|uniref:Outer membrane receptor for ferrienterochelin and colicins n=1 Tax=Mariniphaga anaerophila TaxID=1484053 RepID=A0A1M5B758_9BACT|nr:TonB-dependent receptor [Mariniphaga anaerophila]SHF38353.1 outer membrane receptor for ferrienterochelin and colicins [Mariniphaga anaerophila]
MRFYAILNLFFYLIITSNLNADEPDKRLNTDAMLFGDVKSGGEHIPFASITIKGTTIGTAADATGHFKLTDLPTGMQTVMVSAVGYKPFSKEMEMKANSSVTILAELEPDNIGIEQVVVSADRNAKSRSKTPTIVNSINPKLFQRTQSVTLSDGLNFSPGLRMENNCQNCGFSQVRMNGLEGPYTQILINSRPVFSGLAGVYGLELIPANMIERVEVIRGGGSAMYGSNAIAGTVNLITKDPIANSFSVASNYSSVGMGASPAGDFNLNLNGSFVTDDYRTGITMYGFYRDRNPYDANGDGYSELSAIDNNTLGARFFQRVATRGKITIDYFHINEFRRGGNKFDLPLHESDITESVDHSINSGSATFDLLMREADKLTVFFSAQQVDRNSYYGANQDLSAYGETNDFTFSSGVQYLRQLDYFIFAPATLTGGLEINGSQLQDKKLGYYDIEKQVHMENTPVADQHITTEGAFLQSEWSKKKWTIATGVRYDHYQITDDISSNKKVSGDVFSPRLSLLYNLSHEVQARVGFAKGFRAPQIFDEDLHIETSESRQVLHRNDPNLKQETSNSYTASLSYTLESGKWQYQFLAEGFYTRLSNPFSNEYGDSDENGTVIYTRKNAEKGAKVQGVNLEFNASPSNRWQFQSGFTMQKSEFEEPQEFNETRFFRSPDSYGYLSMNYQPSPRLNISATGNYTGQMLVPYFGPALEEPEEGELRESQAFFDAGLKVSYSIKITDYIKMELNAGMKNIFNSYQNDFDLGADRDPAYIYGPTSPRTIYFGLRFGSLL